MSIKLKSLIVGTAIVGTFAVTGTSDASAADVKVQKGDTLWDISQANNITVDQLKKYNKLSNNTIHPNQVLKTSVKANVSEPSKPAPNKPSKGSSYSVKAGDTLWGISKKNNVSVNNLKKWNNLNSDIIHINQKLKVSNSSTTVKPAPSKPSSPSTNNGSSHVVKSGDTLYAIASANNVTVNNLKSWNNLKSNTIHINQKLVLKGNGSSGHVDKTEKPVEKPQSNEQVGVTMTVEATAYTAYCVGCSGITYTGIDLRKDPNAKVIAVDPKVIPLGSRVHVEGYGNAIAGDIGGDIKGKRIDLHMPTRQEALNFGRRDVKVTILK